MAQAQSSLFKRGGAWMRSHGTSIGHSLQVF